MANTIPNQPIIFDYSDDCLLASDDSKSNGSIWRYYAVSDGA